MQRTPQESRPMTVAAGTKPHPIFLAGRWVESPDVLVVDNPADAVDPRRHDLHRDRGAVRGSRRGGRRGLRGDPGPARLRARPDPARHQRGAARAARGDRPADRARGRQADPRRARRGGPRGPDLPARRRGGGTDDRRGDPARPAAVVEGPDRDHPALPDRPDRRRSARSTSRSTWRPTRSRRRSPRATRSSSSRRPRIR